MGTAWGRAAVALSLVLVGMAQGAAAAQDDCIEAYVAITPTWGQPVRACPGGPGPGAPDGGPPGVPVPGPTLPSGNNFQTYKCPAGSYGIEFDYQWTHYYACVSFDVKRPTPQGFLGDGPSSPSDDLPGTESCPPGTSGTSVRLGANKVGACVVYEYALPDMEQGGDIWIDLTSCSIPEGPGVDPGVRIYGGGVAFCVIPWIMIGGVGEPIPGEELPIEVITDPCTTRGTDPGVVIGDGHVLVCVEVGYHNI